MCSASYKTQKDQSVSLFSNGAVHTIKIKCLHSRLPSGTHPREINSSLGEAQARICRSLFGSRQRVPSWHTSHSFWSTDRRDSSHGIFTNTHIRERLTGCRCIWRCCCCCRLCLPSIYHGTKKKKKSHSVFWSKQNIFKNLLSSLQLPVPAKCVCVCASQTGSQRANLLQTKPNTDPSHLTFVLLLDRAS